jgi:hypothetical protein
LRFPFPISSEFPVKGRKQQSKQAQRFRVQAFVFSFPFRLNFRLDAATGWPGSASRRVPSTMMHAEGLDA